MNILFVIDSLEIGGAETFLMRLMKELSKRKHRIFIYTVNPGNDNPTFARFFMEETGSVRIHDPKKHGRIREFFFYKINAVLKRSGSPGFYAKYLQKRKDRHFKNILLKRYRIDIINSHLHTADVFTSRYLKPLLKKPQVITMQGCYETVIDTRDHTVIERAVKAITGCDAMTYVAEKNLEFLKLTRTEAPRILKKIYNGLEVPDPSGFKKRKEIGLSETDFILGQISRSIESKGMEIAARAVVSLVEGKGYSDIKLILIGPENEYYKDLRSKYSGKKYILFPGTTHHAVEWAGLFDVGILPTYFSGESCPSSIIEYLACGKPVISTDIGEIPGMLAVGKETAGILVSKKEENGIPEMAGFVTAIERYFTDKKLYKEHAALTHAAFEKFSIDHIGDEYLAVYKKVLKTE
jgi:L-malate glycosyltransferase